ncbi:MAG TPA: hypothetical protein VFE62_17940 [Gemmataceae bacterium]|nr:hypothetical protein [Gemmataceae bacterium]
MATTTTPQIKNMAPQTPIITVRLVRISTIEDFVRAGSDLFACGAMESLLGFVLPAIAATGTGMMIPCPHLQRTFFPAASTLARSFWEQAGHWK